MNDILSIENLSLQLGTSKEPVVILNGITLNLPYSSIVSILGPSGAGKSMLLRSIMGLFEAYSNYDLSGSIKYTKEKPLELVNASRTQLIQFRRQEVGIVFQQSSQILNPSQRIGRQILERKELLDGNKEGGKIQVLDLLKEVSLYPVERFYDAYPHQLSGGELQRCLIAMALANDPKLMLIDEPTSNLDEALSEQITDLLLSVQKKRGVSILLITHELKTAKKLSQRIYRINEGRIIDSFEKSEFDKIADENLFKSQKLNGLNSATDILLSLNNITKSYAQGSGVFSFKRKTKPVISDFSLELKRGEVLGIEGPSGSGKSTLARIIALLEDYDAGTYMFEGQNIETFSKKETKAFTRSCQIVFQDSNAAMAPHIKVSKLLSDVLEAHDLPVSIEILEESLSSVKVSVDKLETLSRQLSGGQRQRIMIAKALLVKPKLLICDEILASLDFENQLIISKILRDLVKESSVTVVFISHNKSMNAAICDRIIEISS